MLDACKHLVTINGRCRGRVQPIPHPGRRSLKLEAAVLPLAEDWRCAPVKGRAGAQTARAKRTATMQAPRATIAIEDLGQLAS